MIPAPEMRPIIGLWQNVLLVAIEDHRRSISAAKRGMTSIGLGGGRAMVISSYEQEVEAARAYFTSKDGREVAANAGISVSIDEMMAYLTAPAPVETRWSRRPTVTDELQEQVSVRRRNGESLKSIARTTGVSTWRVKVIAGEAA